MQESCDRCHDPSRVLAQQIGGALFSESTLHRMLFSTCTFAHNTKHGSNVRHYILIGVVHNPYAALRALACKSSAYVCVFVCPLHTSTHLNVLPSVSRRWLQLHLNNATNLCFLFYCLERTMPASLSGKHIQKHFHLSLLCFLCTFRVSGCCVETFLRCTKFMKSASMFDNNRFATG